MKARLSSEIHKIADNYGLKPQSDLLVEEMSELIKALSKYNRIVNTDYQQLSKPISEEEIKMNIAEEISDVEIMLEQVRYLFDIPYDTIEEIKEKKVKRTLDLIFNQRGYI